MLSDKDDSGPPSGSPSGSPTKIGPLLSIAPPPEKPVVTRHAAVQPPPNDLFVHAKKGDAAALEALLQTEEGKALVNIQNYEGNTPVLIAAHWGHVACVRQLVAAGASLSIFNKMGSTPLLVAAYNGHAECVAAILEGGAAVDSADRHKRTPLHAACHKGRVEVARLLLDGGADATRGDAGGSLALHAAAHQGHTETVELLVDRGAPLDLYDGKGSPALLTACLARRSGCVAALLSRIDFSNEASWRPAHAWAVHPGHGDAGHIECATMVMAAVATAQAQPVAAPEAVAGDAAAAEAAAAEAAAAEAAEVAEGDGADPNRKNVWVAKTGALAGKELDAAWVERMKKESDLRLDEQFTLGQHYWMQNPYFKDGTKLRLGPSQDDEMMDQYVLNDDEVEVMEIRNDTGFVSVRRVGSDLTGWVRGRNLSNIRREAGLQDLGELAQMAVDELVKREADMEELEIRIADQEEDLREQRKKIGQQIFEIARQRGEIARQRDEIGTLKQELVKVTAAGKIAQYVRAKHPPTPGVNPECEPGAKHPPTVDPGFTLPRSTPEHETALAAPAVSYGGAIDQATALEKANLQRELGAARDRVLELEQENEFLLVQLEGYRHGAPKEGYRVAELPLAQAAKAAVLEVMAMGAALAAERKMGQQEQPGPQVIGDEPGLPISALSIETRADEAAYARALKMQDAEQCASEVATTLKLAIEKSGFKIQTLFAEAAKLALEL